MTLLVLYSAGGFALWVVLASLIPLLPLRHRALGFWVLVACGVPALGWLTLRWGPSIGVAAFGLGLLILLRLPSRASVQGTADESHS